MKSLGRVNWIAFCGIVDKEVTRILRIWPQTLLPSAITMTLYFVIFGHVIGQRIGLMGGVDYIQFIVPGLIMMPVITNSYSNVTSSFFSTRLTKSIEELLVAPVSPVVVILGYITGGMMRGLSVGILVFIVAQIFSPMMPAHPALSVAILMLASALFSLVGLINGIFARNFDDVSIIPTFVLTPLIYLGGVFYNTDALTPLWQSIANLNPIHSLIAVFRLAVLDIGSISSVNNSLIVIACAIAGCFYLCWYVLSKGHGIKP